LKFTRLLLAKLQIAISLVACMSAQLDSNRCLWCLMVFVVHLGQDLGSCNVSVSSQTKYPTSRSQSYASRVSSQSWLKTSHACTSLQISEFRFWGCQWKSFPYLLFILIDLLSVTLKTAVNTLTLCLIGLILSLDFQHMHCWMHFTCQL